MKKSSDQPTQTTRVRQLLSESLRSHRAGQTLQAESLLSQALEIDPRSTEAVVAQGIIAAETNRPEIALEKMELAIGFDPNNVLALCWLCVLLIEFNRIDDARDYCERALALDPHNPTANAAYGHCLVVQGFLKEAVLYFQKAIQINPNNPRPLYELADVLLALNREPEAIPVLRQAVTLAPEPTALLKMAYLELGLGKIEEAERYGKRALRGLPDSVAAHALLGRVFTEQQRNDEAQVHWTKAEVLDGGSGSFHLQKAHSLASIGLFDEAQRELQSSIEKEPVQGLAYQAIAYSKRIDINDSAFVILMKDVLAKDVLGSEEKMALLFALGKAQEDLGEFGEAINYFDQANSLKASSLGQVQFDRDAFSKLIDQRIALFSRELFSRRNQSRIESSLPVVVVGIPRSGTTLVEQILSCHSKVGGAGEQRFWGETDISVIDYDRSEFRSEVLMAKAREYVQLLSSLAPGFERVIDKNPANLLVLGSMHLALPKVKIIHTRRHPLDTAISIWTTPITTNAEFIGDRESIVFAYQQYERLMKHWRGILPSSCFLEVDYESLVTSPEIEVRRMLEFCELEFEEACLYPETNSRRIRTPSFWQVRQPIYRSSTERWKRYEKWLGAFRELSSE